MPPAEAKSYFGPRGTNSLEVVHSHSPRSASQALQRASIRKLKSYTSSHCAQEVGLKMERGGNGGEGEKKMQES